MRNSGVIQTHDYYANETEKDRAINAFKSFDPENDSIDDMIMHKILASDKVEIKDQPIED